MVGLGFHQAALEPLFPEGGISGRNNTSVPGYERRLRKELGPEAADLAMFWLMRYPLSRDRLETLFGKAALEAFLEANVVSLCPQGCRPELALYPVRNGHVFTDSRMDNTGEDHRLNVYYLGTDSYQLVDVAPRNKLGRCLDVCTGSGVHAVLAGYHSDRVTGVDINPRAVMVSEMNALINGLAGKVDFVQGDLYHAVGNQRYDRITANPPFIPTPHADLGLFRGGGETGEEITERIFRGLEDHLEMGASLMLVTNYPEYEGVDLLEHCRKWLPESSGWGVGLLERFSFMPETYCLIQMEVVLDTQKDMQEMEHWLKIYDRHKIKRVGFGTYFVTRLPQGDNWDEFVTMSNKVVVVPETVEAWLNHRSHFNVESWKNGWQSRRLAVGSGYRLWTDAGGRGLAQYEVEWPDVELSPEEAAILKKLTESGSATAGDLSDSPEPLMKLGGAWLLQEVSE